jgi:hypothetical protein
MDPFKGLFVYFYQCGLYEIEKNMIFSIFLGLKLIQSYTIHMG